MSPTTPTNLLKRVARRVRPSRAQVAAARMRAERAYLASRASARATGRGRILCYHSVGTPQWGVNDVTPARFRRHIELALDEGYRFVAPLELARGGGRPGELAITFDDGVRTVASNAAPILAEYDIPWMLFVVTGWAAGAHGFGEGVLLDWPAIERLAADGAAIGSHSVTHADFALLPAAQARDELVASREALADHLGSAPDAFAIPVGRSVDWSADAHAAAIAAGYTTIWSASEDPRPPGTVARTFITRCDGDRQFRAALRGAYDGWEEWY